MDFFKTLFRFLLALFMIAAGVGHFVNPDPFVSIVPKVLPAPLALVYISGVFEILGGIGLLIRRTQKWAAWGLVMLYVAVFPANINMAINHLPMGTQATPDWLLWLRLPLQGVLIWWAYTYTKLSPMPGGRQNK
jgi:uncharacterized membrane protein